MPLYVRHTRSVRIVELPRRICGKLAEHAASRHIDLNDVRVWLTHSENPPAGSAFGKLLRRRANRADPAEEHWTAVLSVPLLQASMTAEAGSGEHAGFMITGFPGRANRQRLRRARTRT